MNAKQDNPWFKNGNPLSVPKIPIADVRLQQANQSKIKLRIDNFNNMNDNSNKPTILNLNIKLLKIIFNELDTESLARVSRVCRRFNYEIENFVENLQVNVNWDDYYFNYQLDYDKIRNNNKFKQVTLEYCSPKDFFFPYPAFKLIKQLYLCFEDRQEDKIDLTEYVQLKYLKIRGAFIRLSKNRLPTLTHLDIDDPDNLQKQVACNLQNYHLEVDLESLSTLHNATELTMIEYIFTKSLDILLDKPDLEQINFTISIMKMELLLFEKMIDCLGEFLQKFKKGIKKRYIYLLFKYSNNFEINAKDNKRWEIAWNFFEFFLTKSSKDFFKLNVEELS